MLKKNPNKPKGDHWVWFTSLGLTTGLVMVIGIMSFIIWQGVAAFWPGEIVQVKLKEESTARVNGSDYIAGELIKVRDRFEEIDGKRLPVTERQYFIANRDLYNISFRYVDERDIVSTEVPENIMALEKLNDSRALVFPEKLVLEDGSELTKDDPSFLDKYADLVENAEDVRDEILDIEKSKIAPVIKENRQFFIDQYPYLEAMRNNNSTLKAIRTYRDKVNSLESIHSGYLAFTEEEKKKVENDSIKNLVAEIAAAEKELLEKDPANFNKYLDLQMKISAGRIKEAEFSKEATSKRERLLKNVLHYSTASGLNGKVEIGNVIHYFFPNQLSFGGKLGMFVSNVWNFLTEDPRHANTEGGVFPAIIGTLMMTILMCIFVTPFGVIAAIFLHEYAKQGPVVRIVRIAINNLAGVPSIVYGAFGLAFFVYYVGGGIDNFFYKNRLDSGVGPMFGTGGMLWASLTLALLTVPVVIVATEEALAAVPRGTREGALGCGASKWQTIKTVVLPASAPGIITGMILAMARGAGEVAPLMLVGVADIASELPVDSSFPFGVEKKFLHLGYNIYHVGFKTVDSEASRPLVFATTLLLITIVALLNLTGIIIRQKLRKKYASGAF